MVDAGRPRHARSPTWLHGATRKRRRCFSDKFSVEGGLGQIAFERLSGDLYRRTSFVSFFGGAL
jgi:hypothetical protein